MGIYENLIYAGSIKFLDDIFSDGTPETASEYFGDLELMEYYQEASVPDHPKVQARIIINRWRLGKRDWAIQAARNLLETNPDLYDLPGHCAHWLVVTGQIESAGIEYRRLLELNPNDGEVMKMLTSLT
jgi:hypothetical protein